MAPHTASDNSDIAECAPAPGEVGAAPATETPQRADLQVIEYYAMLERVLEHWREEAHPDAKVG